MKKLIKKWLGITKIEEEQKHLNKLFKDYLNVAIDISPSQKDMSWAIVYLNGRPETLKFYGGSHHQIREIEDFLRQFRAENRLVDAPLEFKSFFERI